MDAEELDIENQAALQRYLVANFAPPDKHEIRRFDILAGGVSSRTVRVVLRNQKVWVLKQALAKLRVQADWFSDPRRVHREALGMKVLGELAPAGSIPKFVFDDDRHHVIGMEAVPEPHENWKFMLLDGRIEPRHAAEFGALLGTIHRNAWNRRRELETQFSDRSFFESLRLEPYYRYGAAEEPRAERFYARLIADTLGSALTLVHGDFSPKNILVYADRLVLLDHEVIHWGDPGFDFGFAMAHLISKVHHLPNERSLMTAAATIFNATYQMSVSRCEWSDGAVERGIRHTLGCLLARVVGRSPLEYLSGDERARQREAVVRLIQDVPADMPELITRFVKEIER